MFTTLYLVRHGQTVFNTRLLIQGRCDSPGMLVAVQLLAKGCPGAGDVCIGGGEGVDMRVDGARRTVSGQGDVALVNIERFKQVVGEMIETCVGVGQPRIDEGESDGKRGALARCLLAFDGGVCHGLALSIPRAVRSTVLRVESLCHAHDRVNVKVRRSGCACAQHHEHAGEWS